MPHHTGPQGGHRGRVGGEPGENVGQSLRCGFHGEDGQGRASRLRTGWGELLQGPGPQGCPGCLGPTLRDLGGEREAQSVGTVAEVVWCERCTCKQGVSFL